MARFTTLCALPLSLLLSFATAQGLDIETTKAVECSRKTQDGDKIKVNYKGTLESDGSQFDSSYDRGVPFEFTLGAGQVIAGWDQGLVGMCIGEGRKLTIPPTLGYGSYDNGPIPAHSTLIFETELLAIDGVEPEPQKSPEQPAPERPAVSRPSESSQPTAKTEDAASHPIATAITTPVSSEQAPVHSAPPAAESAATTSSNASPMESGSDNGECHLLGPYALIVQGALGLLAVSSLAFKRWRETPRRPLKIWFFDVSKQVFGSVLLHLANILMSMLSSGKFDVAANTKATPQYAGEDDQGNTPNPCSFYLLNLAIDTTIGIPILVLLLKVLHKAFLLTPMADPPESIRSGNYGHPARATWWLKQSVIYFLGLLGMKLCVFFIFQLLPWIAWVGDWALRWTEGSETLQILFVMFVFPLIMNALQYWIIDGFIKDPAGGEGQYTMAAGEESDDESDDEWLERRRQGRDDDEDSIEDVQGGPLKEANPTAVPVRSREYDPHLGGPSSSRDGRKERSE